MEFSRQYLTRLAEESNFIKDTLEKDLRLSEICTIEKIKTMLEYGELPQALTKQIVANIKNHPAALWRVRENNN